MQIGDLFISLGIKGADKTVAAITGVGDGMKKTASMSLEAKAAIVGATYALQRFFSTSGQTGTNLTNFNSLLGVSAKTLQQYQYAARQVGVSNQEVEGSFKAIQSAMTKTLLGEGAPKGYGRVASLTGGMTAEDIKRFQEHPEQLLQRLQQYSEKETNAGLRNETLKSFGLSENMIAALNRKAFKPEVLAKAPTYSENEIAALDKANIAWSNLGNKIEMAVGHFNALHGGQLVGEITAITDKVISLVTAFVQLADKLEAFKYIGKAFEGWEAIFNGIGAAVDKINGAKTPDQQEKVMDDLGGFFKELPGIFNEITKDILGKELSPKDLVPTSSILPVPEAANQKGTVDKPVVTQPVPNYAPVSKTQSAMPKPSTVASPLAPRPMIVPSKDSKTFRSEKVNSIIKSQSEKTNLKLVTPPNAKITPEKIAPKMAPGAPAAKAGVDQKIEVNQNLHFQHEGKESKQTGDSVKKAVQDAFRQLSSQVQAT